MKILKAIAFVVIAVAVIWAGIAYNKKIDERALDRAEAQKQEMAAQEQQTLADLQKAMENLKIEDVKVGTGQEAKPGDLVTVHYVGTFPDGKKFDSSRDHGQPFEFKIGIGEVIKGWDAGVPGMKVGGIRKLVVPPELGYGDRANGPIPANSTLHFEVELVSIRQ